VIDDPVYHGIVCEEGNDAHLALEFGADQRIDLVDFTDQCGLAPTRDLPSLLLDDDQLPRRLLESFKREQAKNGRRDISIPV
jgi:hypothetical protein